MMNDPSKGYKIEPPNYYGRSGSAALGPDLDVCIVMLGTKWKLREMMLFTKLDMAAMNGGGVVQEVLLESILAEELSPVVAVIAQLVWDMRRIGK